MLHQRGAAMDEVRQAFLREWADTWEWLGILAPDVQPLLTRYTEAHRHYHNAAHVVTCLGELHGIGAPLAGDDRGALDLALFFHDVLYDPQRKDNEEASAVFAHHFLAGLVEPPLAKQVARLVRITDHRHPPAAPDEGLVIDADLSILGQPRAVFTAYEQAIRKEYAHVPDRAFRAGRAKVLEHFLAQPRIYSTDPFFERYEVPARENLDWSMAQLRAETHNQTENA
jgi:predicted metal-dependent HD superfamily phosphohydrolase